MQEGVEWVTVGEELSPPGPSGAENNLSPLNRRDEKKKKRRGDRGEEATKKWRNIAAQNETSAAHTLIYVIQKRT